MSNLGNKEIMAKNIQCYMNKFDKTRQEMCDALGVKYTTFTDWVKGNSYPRIDKIELMANYFGISKAELVEDHNDLQQTEQPYYLNDETRAIVKELFEKPELRAFFHNPGRKLMDNYGQLSDTNKKKVVNYSDNLLAIQRMEEEQLHLIPDAAHTGSDAQPTTIAAHFDGDKYTEDEKNEINQFAEFAKNNKK